MDVLKDNEMEQMSLDIAIRDSYSLDNFYSASNDLLINEIKSFVFSNAPSDRIIFLWGSRGVGKTHILQALQSFSDLDGGAIYLPMENVVNYSSSVLDNLENNSLVCLDNIQFISGNDEWEKAIFHFFNKTWDNGNKVVVSADRNLAELEINLPDLKSRLGWGINFKINELNDLQKVECIQFRAAKRGFKLQKTIAEYLYKRIPRDMGQIMQVLNDIDQYSLSKGKKVTIPFVRTIIKEIIKERNKNN